MSKKSEAAKSTPPAAASTPSAVDVTAADPFAGIEQKPAVSDPVATPDKIEQLRAAIKTLDPELAGKAVQAIAEATKQRKSANQILNTVFGIIGGVAKIAI